jgi:hypothetical protein
MNRPPLPVAYSMGIATAFRMTRVPIHSACGIHHSVRPTCDKGMISGSLAAPERPSRVMTVFSRRVTGLSMGGRRTESTSPPRGARTPAANSGEHMSGATCAQDDGRRRRGGEDVLDRLLRISVSTAGEDAAAASPTGWATSARASESPAVTAGL